MKKKPVVYYEPVIGEVNLNHSIVIKVYSHPKFRDGATVMTSKIIAVVTDTGKFETENSFYVLKK